MIYTHSNISLEIHCLETALIRLSFIDLTPQTSAESAIEQTVSQQLDEYFAGERKTFNIPYLLMGTDFQMAVWSELEKIAWGERISYRELACRIGKPQALRAVGNALGANPIPIILPCHRVLASGGGLGGFAGGLSVKKYLLDLESGE